MTTETLVTDGQTTNTADGQTTADTATDTSTASTEGQQTQAQDADTTTTEGEKTTEGDEGKAEEKQGAPEQYEFKAPEGEAFDNAVIEAYSEVAKELNLSNDEAQKLLDKVAPVIQARQLERIEAVKTEWETASKSDKEFGGDKLNDSLGTAKKALDAFGTPELKALLNESGLGNNPEVIRFMVRAGKAISEDKFVGGRPATPSGNLADKLYSNQKS